MTYIFPSFGPRISCRDRCAAEPDGEAGTAGWRCLTLQALSLAPDGSLGVARGWLRIKEKAAPQDGQFSFSVPIIDWTLVVL
jgi:hypothetical protein